MSILCSLPIIAGLLSGCSDGASFATGYVEGDYTLVAPVSVAQVREITVARGDHVEADTVMVAMERHDAEIALAEAQANVAQAESQLANLQEGARPEEIAVIEANLASATLQADEANRERDRLEQLFTRGVITDAQRDDAITAAQVAASKVAVVSAELAVARLPARPQAIAQAEAVVAAANAALDRAEWQLEQRELSLSVPVTVVDILRQEGEIAGPTAPVLSVLPKGAVKLRLYVPETSYALISVGDTLAVECDGCAEGLTATISYIASDPEFTPPVIYSVENRQKLVYLIEARPTSDHDLNPGQIVNVRLP